MSIKNWIVGQTVVVHSPDNKKDFTTIKAIGRKLITVVSTRHSTDLQFDANLNPPTYRASHTGSPHYLYTPEQSSEVTYVNLVIRRVTNLLEHYSMYACGETPLPMDIMMRLGDLLGVQRPDHLSTKEYLNDSKPPSSRHTVIRTTDVQTNRGRV